VPRRDYYAVLGVAPSASPDDLKKAFRALALKYHPDRNPDDPNAEVRFRELAEAWKVLGDPDERRKYDRLGPLYSADGKPPTTDDLNAFVAETLGGLFRRKGRGNRGEDLRYTLTLTLEEVARGGTRTVQLMRRVACTRCLGSGGDPDGGVTECTRCEGSGKTPGRRLFRSECPHCDGTGQVVSTRCKRCDGAGMRDEKEAIRVRIPPGVAAGQKLKVRKKGNTGRNNGEPGDLYVLVAVAEHELFRRRGQDLLSEVPITLTEAALGTDLEVPTIDGSTTIRVPPGTPGGKVFRLAGRGLPAQGGRPRGDLHLKVEVEVPTDLSPDARAALQRLAASLDDRAHPDRARYREALVRHHRRASEAPAE
jgi:molecular chaperone DnaJ